MSLYDQIQVLFEVVSDIEDASETVVLNLDTRWTGTEDNEDTRHP
jgi:hypothetical protein